uniref:Exostosin GT47 domain-containing protein n=3 Tax=Populus trichocarpa TaxID=3694 RepID=A0A2K2A7B5_POPTR|eukprot:XP_024460386.1 probable glycosyltransferase At3g07620 isoform X1 [Populus trichocarpa]
MPRRFCFGSKIGIYFLTELAFGIVFTIFVLKLDFWSFCGADRTYFGDPFVWIRSPLRFMDQGYQLLCLAKARRLLFLVGATVAIVIVVQYLEFPSSRVLVSLFSAVNTRSFMSRNSSTGSEALGNMTLSNGLNTTNTGILHETTDSDEASDDKKETAEVNKSEEKEGSPNNSNASESKRGSSDSFGLVSNETISDDLANQDKNSTLNTINGSEEEKAMAPDASYINVDKDIAPISGRNKSSDADPGYPSSAPPMMNTFSNKTFSTDENSSPMIFESSNTTSMRKDTAGALKRDENSGLLPNNYSMSTSGSFSSKVTAAKRKTSKKPPSRVISIHQMNELLRQSHASSSSVRPLWPSGVDQEMLFAKSQIENAPLIKNETRLYAPIYRNVSMFRRSYELMEKMLKVYVYQDGEKPIFHQPILDGIYASEGWFMKHMEANENFVTKDPGKAHLFYLPFSSRLLELTLYVRHSHSRTNLIEYMRNYAGMIAAKYHFWNRTGGADHFVAACHDWAPAETRGPLLNCIRALCNADIEVGFSIGKDVSLPETYVRSAQNPLKNLEGNPPSQRPILAFFAGNMHGYVRPVLLDYWGNKDPDMKIFGPMPHVKGNTNYIQHMKSSKFCICPRGHEVNSPRIVEAIFLECVPVIISDNFVPPFFEVLDWESFAVIVLEKDIPNLKNILVSISEEKYIEMHKRVKKVQQHFLWHSKPEKYDLFHMILHSVWYNRIFRIRPA